jgi:isopentenyl-diphosphate Delta-isomerase
LCGGKTDRSCFSSEQRRIYEELGYEGLILKKLFRFHYHEHFDNGLQEHEIDHVFVGVTDKEPPRINPEEIQTYQWVSKDELKQEMNIKPSHYTVWFKLIIDKLNSKPFGCKTITRWLNQ